MKLFGEVGPANPLLFFKRHSFSFKGHSRHQHMAFEFSHAVRDVAGKVPVSLLAGVNWSSSRLRI
jgi:hypothetical protein